MSPRKLKRNLFQSATGQLFQRAVGMRMGKALCEECHCHISETMSWRCGRCTNIVSRKSFRDDQGNVIAAEVMRHSFFGRCPDCRQEPPAVACPHCGHVNPLLDAPPDEQERFAARPPGKSPRVLEEERVAAVAADQGNRLAVLNRNVGIFEAQTKKLEAEFRLRVAERRLNPPAPKVPESPGDAVRRHLGERMAKAEALVEVRDERLADLERRYADDPETLEAMRDLLDAHVEQMRVEIFQER